MNQYNVAEITAKYDGDSSALIAILQDVQEEYRHLPREALSQIADQLSVPLSQA
ncbi:MAG: NAD(P)H-dependent oxidoreductase subunit E, partial [Fidelibacterota bacterium]